MCSGYADGNCLKTKDRSRVDTLFRNCRLGEVILENGGTRADRASLRIFAPPRKRESALKCVSGTKLSEKLFRYVRTCTRDVEIIVIFVNNALPVRPAKYRNITAWVFCVLLYIMIAACFPSAIGTLR